MVIPNRQRKPLDFSSRCCYNIQVFGDVPKWLKGADSKSSCIGENAERKIHCNSKTNWIAKMSFIIEFSPAISPHKKKGL